MPDLARAARGTAKYDPVDHDPGAHSGSDRDDEEAVVTASDAVQALCHGERVDVVLDDDRQPELALQRLTERNPRPAELRGVDDAVALSIDRAGDADAHAEQARRSARDEVREQPRQVGKHGRRRSIERLARRALDGPIQPDLDEGDVVGNDLHADDAVAGRGEAQHPSGATALRGRVLEFDDEAIGEQVLGELRHECRRDAE